MPDTTTDYARGFRAGVEAAAAWLENCAEACDASADLRATASNCRIMATQIRALKRPEPSEALPADVCRLVIAARKVAFEDQGPQALRELDKASEAFAGLVPWEGEPAPAAPEPTDEMKQRLSAWWRSWDTGLSSEAIALFLGMGVKSEHTPSDAADLGRCLRLLDKIPEWRPRLPEMRDAGGAWPFIVDRWPELEALYKAERWDAVYVTLTAAHRTHRAALAAGRV